MLDTMYSVPALIPLALLCGTVRARIDARDSERGYTTEAIVITGGLVLLAVAVLVILYTQVKGTANNINTTPPTVP